MEFVASVFTRAPQLAQPKLTDSLNLINKSSTSNSCLENKLQKTDQVSGNFSNLCLDVYYTNAGSLVNKIDEFIQH